MIKRMPPESFMGMIGKAEDLRFFDVAIEGLVSRTDGRKIPVMMFYNEEAKEYYAFAFKFPIEAKEVADALTKTAGEANLKNILG